MLATSPGTTSSDPGQCLCVCGHLGGHNMVLAPKCAVLGAQVSQEPLRRGVAGQGSWAWGQGDPTEVGAAWGDVGSWTPAMGSFSGAEHSQTHLKGRSGGSLNTKPCLEPGCSEAPPWQPGSCVRLWFIQPY